MKNTGKTFITMLMLLLITSAYSQVVSDVSFKQKGAKVEISYTTHQETCRRLIEASFDGGETFGKVVVFDTKKEPGGYTYVYDMSKEGVVISDRVKFRVTAETECFSPYTETHANLNIEMVAVEGETFTMGSPSSEPGRDGDESQHRVTLDYNFYIGKYEVTQSQYKKLIGDNPSRFANCGGDCPVEQVSWWDAIKYCNKLSEKAGLPVAYDSEGNLLDASGYKTRDITKVKGYRLPTEAEWEYAARAGTTTALYTGSINIKGKNNSSEVDEIGWYGGNSCVSYSNGYDCSGWDEKQYSCSNCGTHEVGRKKANSFGLYDMIGNVWEWCTDWKTDYPSGSVTNPVVTSGGSRRVYRGGSWYNYAKRCRVANRSSNGPGDSNDNLGFRLALSSK